MSDRSSVNNMKPKVEVGFGGANQAVEVLWSYVYQLKERIRELEERVRDLEHNNPRCMFNGVDR